MGRSDYFKPHDNNVICPVCGFKWKGSQMRKRWDGQWVCPDDYEPRHPQDFIRPIKEVTVPPVIVSETTDIELTGYVQALAGATTITSADVGTDNRVVVDVIEQIRDVYTVGAVTITLASSLTSAHTVVIKGVTTQGVSVSVVDNSTGATVTQIA